MGFKRLRKKEGFKLSLPYNLQEVLKCRLHKQEVCVERRVSTQTGKEGEHNLCSSYLSAPKTTDCIENGKPDRDFRMTDRREGFYGLARPLGTGPKGR